MMRPRAEATVLGSGSWGTALAILLARNGHEVALYGRDPEEIGAMSALRENLRYLPGFAIPEGVRFGLLHEADPGDLTVVAVPSGAVRGVLSALPGTPAGILVASKGLDHDSGHLLSQVAATIKPGVPVGVLSGPNLAVEIVRGVPTAAVAASASPELADRARAAFGCASFRVYASDDVTGVEVAGALKNVLAIGSGMAEGLGFGDNTKGALLARGLKEIIALGLAMGGRLETFLGIAGVGDLFATAASPLSRNNRLGAAMGRGLSLAEAIEEVGQTAEGVPTSEIVGQLAREHGVPMPLFAGIEAVLRGRMRAADGVALLMERATREEGLSDVLRR